MIARLVALWRSLVHAATRIEGDVRNRTPGNSTSRVQAEIESLRKLASNAAKPTYAVTDTQSSDFESIQVDMAAVSDEVRFVYRDRQGAKSARHVSVQKADDEYFEGFCHLRRDVRTFLFDSIVGKVTRMSTGELLTAGKWRDELLRDAD